MKNSILMLLGVLMLTLVSCAIVACRRHRQPGSASGAGLSLVFKYGVGAKNVLDTAKGTFTKDMIVDPARKVALRLTAEELDRISAKMDEIDFWSYPDVLRFETPADGVVTMVTPYTSYYFRAERGGTVKELRWDDQNVDQAVPATRLRGLIALIRRHYRVQRRVPGAARAARRLHVSRGNQVVLRKWLVVALAALAVAVAVTASGCVRHRNFANDPVKWVFVGGEGTWDGNSRRWSVDLSRGETKSATIRLDNTGTEDTLVLVQLEGPPDYVSRHLESASIALGDNGVGIRAGRSAEIVISATAATVYASPSPRRYVVDLGWSTNSPWPHPTTAPPGRYWTWFPSPPLP